MLKNILIKFSALSVFCLLIGSGQIFAQPGTGQITGVVTDPNNAVVPSATVTLISKATNQTQTAETSGDGVYRFTALQPGNYTVKTTSGGFAEKTLNVEVQVGRVTDANFALGAGDVGAQVEVTADGVQTTTSNFDAIQDQTAISTLPINGRRFQDFVTLTPSAQVDPSRGQISLSGQRGINTNINVDGVDYNQPFFGGIRGGERSNQAFSIPQESIREFQVVAAGYNAEYGRSSGGIVNAVTKSGSNDLRGSAFYLLRPQRLARGNDYSQALKAQKLGALNLDATLAPTQQQFGGSVGGPIKADKLFYFLSYEQQRFRAPRQVLFGNLTGFTPTATQTEGFNFYRAQEAPYTQTNDAYAGVGKIDWNINNSNRFNIRYNLSQNKALNAVATGETALDPTTTNSLSTNGTERDRNNIGVAQLVTTFSANVINDLHVQYAREDRPRFANATISSVNTSIGIYGTRNFLPTTQYDIRKQVTDGLTYITGNHTIKVGGEFSNIYANQEFGFNRFGTYTFAGLNVPTQILDAVNGTRTGTYLGRFDTTTARYNQQVGNLQAAYTVRQLAFFGQDSWRATKNLTLNYGLRYEKQYNPEAQANNSTILNLIKNTSFPILVGKGIDPAHIPDSPNQWAPRVGFAYDPNADGKTVIRGFAGIYYAATPLISLAAPFNNFRDPAGDLSVTLGSTAYAGTAPGTPTLTAAGTASNFNFTNFFAANPNYSAITGLTAAQCANAGASIPAGSSQAAINAALALYNSCAPNTVFRQLATIGVNLNSSPLTNLPTLTPAQLQAVSTALGGSTASSASNLGIYQNAAFYGITPDYQNPRSFQFGGGIEREIAPGITIGLDYSQVNTVHLQRNFNINVAAPGAVNAATGRVTVSNGARPLTNIGVIALRDSSAHSLYKGLTARISVNQRWGRLSAFYTLSRSTSDDDNERDATGILYDNPYDLKNEYYNSRLDRRHQFVANPVVFLPYGFEVSSAIRLLSGNPINAVVGSDLNGDGNSNERPILVPDVELKRNFYTNRPIYQVDMRVQKGFNFGEVKRLIFTAEFFNVFNRSNIQIGTSSTVTGFCDTAPTAQPLARCGLDGITNLNFLQVRLQNPTSTSFGQINLTNAPGSQVFQMQLGARFQF